MGSLVAAGMVLRGHQDQPRSCIRGPQLLLRRPPTGLQYSEYSRIGRENANSNGERYSEAEYQRHE